MNPRLTAIIAASVLPILGLIDGMFAYFAGNDATFSAVLLRIQSKFAYLAPCIAYSFGMFIGHVFFPSANMRVPPPHEAIAKLTLAAGPILAAIVLIASGDGETPTADTMGHRTQLILFVAMLVSVTIGGLAGRILVPQHPLTWGPA